MRLVAPTTGIEAMGYRSGCFTVRYVHQHSCAPQAVGKAESSTKMHSLNDDRFLIHICIQKHVHKAQAYLQCLEFTSLLIGNV